MKEYRIDLGPYEYHELLRHVPHWHACVIHSHPDHDIALTFAMEMVFGSTREKAEEEVWQRIMRAGIASGVPIDLDHWRLAHPLVSVNSN